VFNQGWGNFDQLIRNFGTGLPQQLKPGITMDFHARIFQDGARRLVNP
jgi:hypothetical protein